MPGFARDTAGAALLAERRIAEFLALAGVPTPAYVYDLDAIRATVRELRTALPNPHLIAYAVKANSAASIVRTLASEGAGADVVSGAELELALACGIEPTAIVMSGVAKRDAEIDLAIGSGIRGIQVESVEEIVRVAARARAVGKLAPISVRINPNVRIDAHAHIATGHDAAKFGIPLADLPAAWQAADAAREAVRVVGVSTHVGSMQTATNAYIASGKIVCDVAKQRLTGGHSLDYIDFGGGFGIEYGVAPVQPPGDFARAALGLLKECGLSHLSAVVEPGRSLVGSHGVLVASVIQSKIGRERRWIMIDAGMNDLIRPALYAAVHRIEPLLGAPGGQRWRVVGPVCESSDDFGEHALGDEPPAQVVIRDAGAYGFVMASEYNGRSLPSEVFVAAGRVVKVSASPGANAWLQKRLEA
jgi:diaminopimelate decarboxylase